LIEAIRHFADADVCRNYLAECRWPNGISCPRKGCGSKEVWFIRTRAIWRCKSCRKQFSVKVGTIFEDSPIALDKWLPAVWLLTCSTKGYSSHLLAKALGVTQKTAWFMLHRIRLAMRAGNFETPMSGPVEGDTTGIGGKEKKSTRPSGHIVGLGMSARPWSSGCSHDTDRFEGRAYPMSKLRRLNV